MKKHIYILLTMLLVSLTGFALDKYTINREDLPQTAQDFLTEYFPTAKVSMIKVDKHLLKKTDYDVKLLNGTKIEFSNSGKWTSVDCQKSAVPDGIIPGTIRKYVTNNYSGQKIVKIEKSTTKYTVKLSNNTELLFSLLGIFKGVKE